MKTTIVAILLTAFIAGPAMAADDCPKKPPAKRVQCYEKKVDALTGKLNKANSDIATLGGKLDDANKSIVALSGKVDALNKTLTLSVVTIKSEGNECLYEAPNHGVSLQSCTTNPQAPMNWSILRP